MEQDLVLMLIQAPKGKGKRYAKDTGTSKLSEAASKITGLHKRTIAREKNNNFHESYYCMNKIQ